MPLESPAEWLLWVEGFVHASFARARANSGPLRPIRKAMFDVAEATLIGAIDEAYARVFQKSAVEPTHNLIERSP